MNIVYAVFRSSVGKKYLMALSGLVLVGFVLGHMLGNLQVFGPPELINGYAYKLHYTLPTLALWAIRLFLLATVAVHILTAVLLVIENKRARPESYDGQEYKAATFAARTMKYSGIIILAFIVFHILHYTTRSVDPAFEQLRFVYEGTDMVDVYAMMIVGFSKPLVSLFYIVATALLCWHLMHGVSSMFQSLGVRNEVWRYRLNNFALAYGWIVFIGFAIIPVAVLISWHTGLDLMQADLDLIRSKLEGWDGSSPIFISYR